MHRAKKLWYLLLRTFWPLLSNVNFCKRDLRLGYLSIQIWDISYFPQILSLTLLGISEGNTSTKFAKFDIKFPSELSLNNIKVQNIKTKIVWKFLILVTTFSTMIQVSEKSTHLAKKCQFYQNLPMSNVERFLKTGFDLNHISKIVLTKNR